MIVDQEVTNQVVDMGLLTQTAEPAGAILEVETIDVVADRGYFKIEWTTIAASQPAPCARMLKHRRKELPRFVTAQTEPFPHGLVDFCTMSKRPLWVGSRDSNRDITEKHRLV
jgi:hypothetical protein